MANKSVINLRNSNSNNNRNAAKRKANQNEKDRIRKGKGKANSRTANKKVNNAGNWPAYDPRTYNRKAKANNGSGPSRTNRKNNNSRRAKPNNASRTNRKNNNSRRAKPNNAGNWPAYDPRMFGNNNTSRQAKTNNTGTRTKKIKFIVKNSNPFGFREPPTRFPRNRQKYIDSYAKEDTEAVERAVAKANPTYVGLHPDEWNFATLSRATYAMKQQEKKRALEYDARMAEKRASSTRQHARMQKKIVGGRPTDEDEAAITPNELARRSNRYQAATDREMQQPGNLSAFVGTLQGRPSKRTGVERAKDLHASRRKTLAHGQVVDPDDMVTVHTQVTDRAIERVAGPIDVARRVRAFELIRAGRVFPQDQVRHALVNVFEVQRRFVTGEELADYWSRRGHMVRGEGGLRWRPIAPRAPVDPAREHIIEVLETDTLRETDAIITYRVFDANVSGNEIFESRGGFYAGPNELISHTLLEPPQGRALQGEVLRGTLMRRHEGASGHQDYYLLPEQNATWQPVNTLPNHLEFEVEGDDDIKMWINTNRPLSWPRSQGNEETRMEAKSGDTVTRTGLRWTPPRVEGDRVIPHPGIVTTITRAVNPNNQHTSSSNNNIGH